MNLPPLTDEQQTQVSSMKRSVEVLRAVARNCRDTSAAADINRQCENIMERVAVLEGTPAKYTPADRASALANKARGGWNGQV